MIIEDFWKPRQIFILILQIFLKLYVFGVYCLILKAIAYSVPSQCLSLSLSVRLAVSHILPVSVSLFVWLVAWVFPKGLFIFTVNFLFSLISDWLPTNLKWIYIITLYLYWWVEVSNLYMYFFSGKICP